MKTFEEILKECWANEGDTATNSVKSAAHLYAKQTAQDALNRAATRATADIQNGKVVIEKSSILTTEIRFV